MTQAQTRFNDPHTVGRIFEFHILGKFRRPGLNFKLHGILERIQVLKTQCFMLQSKFHRSLW